MKKTKETSWVWTGDIISGTDNPFPLKMEGKYIKEEPDEFLLSFLGMIVMIFIVLIMLGLAVFLVAI